ncbi:ABC transporter permease [Oceanobacillus sp. CAU 1775]
MFRSVTNNTFTLTKFILRLDRVRLLLWLVGIIFFTLIVPIAFDGMYASQEERDVMAETMNNPAMVAMVGPGDIENYTTGAMTAHNMLLFTAVVVGLMSILLVVRHTRANEEDGRIEMINALPVGRLANLNATLIALVSTFIILALITSFGLYALGIESMDLEGSLLYGAVLGATGIFFTGLSAVISQIFVNSRSATGISIAALLIAYLLRAIGDVSNEVLSFISPLGWITQTEVYSSNHWWPVLLLVGFGLILFIVANYLNAIRDLGSGFIHARPGRKNASALLLSPLGHAFRLQRTAFISWAIGMLVLGASYGSVMGDLESFFEGNELLEQMLIAEEGYSLTEQFIPMLMLVMGILAAIPPIMAMNKLLGEEKKNRIDHLLARAVSRSTLIGSYLIISLISGFVMVSFSAIGLWSAADAVMEEGFSLGTIYEAGIVYYPAILVMIGFSVFLIGWLPKFSALAWVYLLYSFVVLYLGGLFDMPEWIGKLSSFSYIPQLPVESMDWVPIILLTFIAVLLMVLGFIGYRRRDIEG